ncbi:tetratricopeptide repeat protein [Streptomyces sp. NPDC050095]|uniref:ATP-binding protein n=1 Tax=unclassified Streptomyces TaxID=2593676 RepID=UPI00344742B6
MARRDRETAGLDSCEHLVDECRLLISDLLTAVPALTVLATSRQTLQLRDECVVEIGPLSFADGDPKRSDAMRLFTSRAAEVAPGTDLSSPSAQAAAVAVCRRLEGLPLALELAGGQLRHTDVRTLSILLGSLRNSLSATGPTRPPRHRSLRTTIGWSHELCSPAERLLWARLSVLRGPFDTAAAHAVCGGGPLTADVFTLALSGLVDKCVVGKAGHRYHMLDSIKEYGGMWLDELGEQDPLADRHAAYFHRLVAHAEARWAGSEQVLVYRHVNDAFPDICAALDHLLAVAPAEGLDLAARVGFFWSCCGHLHEARAYLERGLALHSVPQSVRGRGLWTLGVVLVLQGEYDQAEQLGTVCTRLAQQGEDDEAALAAAYLLGITYLMTGRPLAAHTAAERALSDTQADVGSAARLRCRLVTVFACTALGALGEAEILARRLLADCDRTGEVWARSYLDYQLALLALLQDRPRDAAVHARAMLQGKQLLGDRFGTALGIDVLAAALAEDGREEDAALLSGVGQAYWHAVGHVQRGTPELAPVRERTRQLALAALGEDVYALARRRGAQDTEGGLALALDDGC